MPFAADDQEHEIQDLDIVVMASDGMFDNVYEKEISKCVGKSMKDKVNLGDPQEAA